MLIFYPGNTDQEDHREFQWKLLSRMFVTFHIPLQNEKQKTLRIHCRNMVISTSLLELRESSLVGRKAEK